MRPFLSLVLAFITTYPSFVQPVRHVILITIDGMRPVFPTVTLPNHTSMITGALPARHGVYFNAPFNPLSSAPSWNFYADLIKSPTLFDKIHEKNLLTAAIDWPVTVGSPSIDYNFPDYWGFDDKTDNIALIRKGVHPAGLWEKLEANAIGKNPSDEINSDHFLRTDENAGRIAAYLIMTYKPAFTAFHITETDHAQHDQGRESYAIRTAVAAADRAIGDVLEAVERAGITDSTTIIIAGDQGFADIHSAIYPNVWLAKAGIFHPNNPHWRAKFQSASGSAFLYLEDKNDTAAVNAVRQTLDNLPESYRRLFRLIQRPELDRLGVDSSAQLAFAPIIGIAVGNSGEGEVLRAAHGGTHGFMNDTPEMMTGFIACGAGIRKGTVIPMMNTPDIAPLIAKLLGIDFPCPDGILYPGILKK